jgi:hypothetical protein
VIAITATKKKASDPNAKTAAKKNVTTATTLTPMGRLMFFFPKDFELRRNQSYPSFGFRARHDDRLFHSAKCLPSIAIWMAVAPVPIILLVFVVLFAVFAITFVMFAQVTAVGVIFAAIPVVVVMVA